MKKKIMSFCLAVLMIIGFIPKVSATEDNHISNNEMNVTTDASVSLDNEEYYLEKIEDDSEYMALLSEDLETVCSLPRFRVYNYDKFKDGELSKSSLASYIDSDSMKMTEKDEGIEISFDYLEKFPLSNLYVRVGNDDSITMTEKRHKDGRITFSFIIDEINDSMLRAGNLEESIILGMTVDTGSYGKMSHEVVLVIGQPEYPHDEDKTSLDGIYNLTYKFDNTMQSHMMKFIDPNMTLKVDEDKKTVRIVYKNAFNMMSNFTASVNGQSKTVETAKEEKNYDGELKEVLVTSFEIDDIYDDIVLGLTVAMGTMQHNYKIILYISDAEYSKELTDEEIQDESRLKDGDYTIESTILKTGTTEESMAAGYFEKVSDLKVENKEYNYTLYTKFMSSLSEIVVKVDGKEVPYEIVNKSSTLGGISFKINELKSTILIKCRIKMTGYDAVHDFNVSLNTNSLKNDTGQSITPPVEDSSLPLYVNASYTIDNEIVGNFPNAARYIDTKSLIEVENEKIYLTVTFNKSEFMEGREAKLNDNTSVTPYNVVNDTNKTTVRIQIYSLSDTIKISPVTKASDEEFVISLVKETLKKVEENLTDNNSGSSNDEDDDDSSNDDDIDDGVYTIKNKVYKENSNTTSDARGYLDDESVLIVDDGKMYLVLKFTHGKMMSDTSIKVEGKSKSYTVVKKSGNKLYIKYKINSLSDETMVTTTIDTGTAIGVLKNVKFRVLLRSSTLEEDDDADDDFSDDEEEDEDVSTESSSEENSELTDAAAGSVISGTVEATEGLAATGIKKATYKVENDIVTDSTIGYQAARGAINKNSYYEIINDTDHYITLGLNQTDVMTNVRLSIDGSNISYDTISENSANKTKEIRFKIPSLSKEITVSTYVTAMSRDISFGIRFLESTLQLISIEENAVSDGSSTVAGMLSSLGGNPSGFNASTLEMSSALGGTGDYGNGAGQVESKDIKSEAAEYYKRYSISNEVVSDSAIGRTMARKYLNSTSIIDEIDGKLYATVTFSSADSMGNFKFEVAGKSVDHSVVLNSNGQISLRFPINKIDDDIRVYIYINPMKMNINFGIKFLKDTMILLEEGTVSKETDKALANNLNSINAQASAAGNSLSVWKIAVITALLSTLFNVITFGSIYLIVKKVKKRKRLKTAKVLEE